MILSAGFGLTTPVDLPIITRLQISLRHWYSALVTTRQTSYAPGLLRGRLVSLPVAEKLMLDIHQKNSALGSLLLAWASRPARLQTNIKSISRGQSLGASPTITFLQTVTEQGSFVVAENLVTTKQISNSPLSRNV